MDKTNYIAPYINTASSENLKDFFNASKEVSSGFFSKTISWEDLTSEHHTVVLGEPGYGKTRLFRELYDKFNKEDKQCCWVELKSVDGKLISTIEEYLEERAERRNIFAAADFQLEDSNKNVLFLDALDEVYSGHIPSLIDDIKNLNSKYPSLKILLSCRTHHILRYESDLYSFNYNCVEVRAFNTSQTVDFLQSNCEKLKEVDKEVLFNQLKETNLSSSSFFDNQAQPTLATPRYLEIIAELITESSLESILGLARHELFERIIIERLKKEAKKNRVGEERRKMLNNVYLMKQYLERLALIMEMQRVNVITKDDLATFNLDTKMNIDPQIMSAALDGTILKDNIDTLEFDNTEFQEYLAAQAISRLGRTEQIIFDLAIEQKLKNIYPSWINVVGYLIELHPELLLPLIRFATRVKQFQIFELIRFYRIELKPDTDDSQVIFSEIFSYYVKQEEYIPHRFVPQLCKFYAHSHHYENLKETYAASSLNSNVQNSIIQLLHFIIDTEVLNDAEVLYWKNTLTKIASFPDTENHVAEEAIRTLGKVSTIEELNPFEVLTDRFRKSFRDTLLTTYIRIDPNHVRSIEGILDEILRKEISFAENKLSAIDKKEGFLLFFSKSINDKEGKTSRKTYISAINDDISFYGELRPLFFRNLSSVWDEEIEDLVISFLIESTKKYFGRRSSFFLHLQKLLIEKNSLAWVKVLENIEINPKDGGIELGISDFFGKIVKSEDFASFYSEAIKLGITKDSLYWIVKGSGNEEIRGLEKIYFPEKYAILLKSTKEWELKDVTKKAGVEFKQDEKFKKFIVCLNKNHLHILEDYNRNKIIYEERLTPFQRKKLTNFALSYIETNKLDDSKVEIEGNTTTTYGVAVLMCYALEIVLASEIDMSKYRSKLLRILLFSFNTENIFKAVPNITHEEFEELMNWFNLPRKDNLQISGVDKILDLIEKNQIKVASGFLVRVLEDEKLSYFKRKHALRLLHTWNKKPLTFYASIFKKAIAKDTYDSESKRWSNDYRIALEINAVLLQEEMPEAIDWRMNEVKNSRYAIPKDFSGVRAGREEEDLGSPLNNIKDIRFKDKMLAYLRDSFDALAENEDYYRYVQTEYWDIIINYFCNLKVYKRQLPQLLDELRDIVNEYSGALVSNTFAHQLQKIENEYLAYLSQPEKFSRCVQQFNQLKSKQYIDIAYSQELFDVINDVINTELRDWVNQGYYGVIEDLKSTTGGKVEKERLIQKTLITHLEIFLLKRGFRESDIQQATWNFYREAEKLDGEKTDIIVTYGAIGAVMIEVKRAGNPDLSKGKREGYKTKLLSYIEQSSCDYGIFLIFRTEPKAPVKFEKQIQEVKEIYEGLSHVTVIGLDCTKQK